MAAKTWQQFAVELENELTKGPRGGAAEIKDDKDLKKFLKRIGYDVARTTGSHTIFNLQDEKKFNGFVRQRGYEGDIPCQCVHSSVSVNNNAKRGTIKDVLDQVLRLDDFGQKKKS